MVETWPRTRDTTMAWNLGIVGKEDGFDGGRRTFVCGAGQGKRMVLIEITIFMRISSTQNWCVILLFCMGMRLASDLTTVDFAGLCESMLTQKIVGKVVDHTLVAQPKL